MKTPPEAAARRRRTDRRAGRVCFVFPAFAPRVARVTRTDMDRAARTGLEQSGCRRRKCPSTSFVATDASPWFYQVRVKPENHGLASAATTAVRLADAPLVTANCDTRALESRT